MKFSWELELTIFSTGEIDQTLKQYYEELQNQARELVEQIAAENFSESLSKLHGIDEKCQLLFFFLEHTEELWFKNSSEVIGCIEGDYQRSYLEKLPSQLEHGRNSLLYIIS
ncbi:hypothetical protein I6N96_00790 [Enterococcus sp. BWM-S5]|uniref:Uncharacterized protein n=1 Tax=Enterococcus larvae TaxID=2794352 RepID=A0ABS4CFS9_9ENTE|nr:hypothetical protein [Enterococcus larvae]MBP1044797.1 hypothetical protein [Enterococcus larvae]